MTSLFAALAASVATLMIIVKQFEAGIAIPTDPAEQVKFQQRLDLFNLGLSLVLGIVGALVMLSNTPDLFANDPAFIASNPVLFAIITGLISVLPGGVGTTLMSALLIWLGLKQPTAQSVRVAPVRRSLVLWG